MKQTVNTVNVWNRKTTTEGMIEAKNIILKFYDAQN